MDPGTRESPPTLEPTPQGSALRVLVKDPGARESQAAQEPQVAGRATKSHRGPHLSVQCSAAEECAVGPEAYPSTHPLGGRCKPMESCRSPYMHATALPTPHSLLGLRHRRGRRGGGAGRGTSFRSARWPKLQLLQHPVACMECTTLHAPSCRRGRGPGLHEAHTVALLG